MPEQRRIVLRREPLTELSTETLGSVVGAATDPCIVVPKPTECGWLGSCGPGCTAISSHPD